MRFVKEAWPFVVPFVILALVLLAFGWLVAAAVATALALALLLFFRDPKRLANAAPEVIVSAADGKVTGIDTIEDPDLGPGARRRVITFLSVFDVHVQRAPLPGTVIASKARAGRKLAAFRADVDRVNENHLTVLRSEGGVVVGVRQIAGLLARRVVPYLRVGQSVQRGELMGVIKFGSRVDVLLPSDYQILVSVGDRVRCGETPLAAPLAGPIAGPIAGKSERS